MTEQEMRVAEEILEVEVEEVLRDTDRRISRDFHLIILRNTTPLSYIRTSLSQIWAYLPRPMGITFPITTISHSKPLKLLSTLTPTINTLTHNFLLNRAIIILLLSQPLQLHNSKSSLTLPTPPSLTSNIKLIITLILGPRQ